MGKLMSGLKKMIFEEEQEKQTFNGSINELMSDEQRQRGQYYSQIYSLRRAELDAYKEEWDELWKMYDCEREPDPNDPYYPNSFIPVVTPVVEGQIASIMEANIQYTYTTNNPAHKPFMKKLEAASKYIRGYNQSARHFKDFARVYDLLGNSWVTVSWEKSFSNNKDKPKGFPKISTPPILSVLVDGRIKDYKDLQYAEYIIHEIGFQTLQWAKREYKDAPGGLDKVNAISMNTNRYEGEETEITMDDTKSFMLLHVWTRSNEQGNLQLIEMDSSGIILRESDPSKPYYDKVDNEYPFFFARMMPRQGRFYGYGDGKILKPIQQVMNKLTDDLEIACRFSSQSRTYIDGKKARMDLSQFDSDPSHPILCDNPRGNVLVTQGQGINNVVVEMLAYLYSHAQRAVRFSEMMTGNQQGVSATATQINGQLMQGQTVVNDKKSDISQVMKQVDRYCIKLCLEKWDIPFWANLDGKVSEYIDMTELNSVPASVPTTTATMQRYIENGYGGKDIPSFEVLYENNDITKTSLDFDVEVAIGTEFPHDKNSLYNQILALMQIQSIDPMSGRTVPFLTLKKAREYMTEITGYELSDDENPMEDNPALVPEQANVNPLGQSGGVQMPMGSQMPAGLMQNVPGMQTTDKRGMQL